ncbi:MAG: hypothetical protein ACOC80_00830 [Petrotogales bacterium]
MKYLSEKTFSRSVDFIRNNARSLEKSYLENIFFKGDNQSVISEIEKFQNKDGGFGNAIEPDLRMPFSSPISTSVGVRYLNEFDKNEKALKMIKAAITYLEGTFNKERNGWFALDRRINDYPHAPWWHYDEKKEQTIIDENWGNPSAEIIAYLFKYVQYVDKLNVEKLVDIAIKNIVNKVEFNSENEIFCYLKLVEVLNDKNEQLKSKLTDAIEQVIVYDSSRWNEYVPQPVDFLESPKKQRFSIPDKKINENLDFIIELLENQGKIEPPWGRSFYSKEMEPAYKEWQGILTLKALTVLKRYGRLHSKV